MKERAKRKGKDRQKMEEKKIAVNRKTECGRKEEMLWVKNERTCAPRARERKGMEGSCGEGVMVSLGFDLSLRWVLR